MVLEPAHSRADEGPCVVLRGKGLSLVERRREYGQHWEMIRSFLLNDLRLNHLPVRRVVDKIDAREDGIGWWSPIRATEILLRVDCQSITKILAEMTIGPGPRHAIKITANDRVLTSQLEEPGA